MERTSKQGGEIMENKYMKLVQEEQDLYRIPKRLDTDCLKKEMLFGEKVRSSPAVSSADLIE